MKALKIAALGFAAVLAVASLGLAFGVPAGFLAKPVQDQIESRTGYRLHIDGDTKLAFRPSPSVTLGRISLLDGGSAAGFAADSVRVSVSLASLFSGRLGITEVAIVKPVVRAPLLRQRESRAGGGSAPAGDGRAAALPAFALDRLIVEDGTVVMSNARDGVEMRVDRIALTASLAAEERADRSECLCGRSARPIASERQIAARGVRRGERTGRLFVRGARASGGHAHRHERRPPRRIDTEDQRAYRQDRRQQFERLGVV